ncbi:MAG: UDP-N-acetylglucosamine 2-epimerase (hydrolyzing) [Ruminococcaceae bacterium]|nr:UDP-N-acetylglucosamine 2-epimerase (hydrolyzing) [Oscillospiraceae bacterium]
MYKKKYKIAVITSTRADFGLLRPVIDELNKFDVETKLIVTGTHLSKNFGLTKEEIISLGYSVDFEVPLPMDLTDNTKLLFKEAFNGFSSLFNENSFDLLVVLGDRFEILSASLAAFLSDIPIAHISGGDVTTGAKDDAFRHCITKLSYLHFSSTEEARTRIIQLGESPDRVFFVGGLGAENIEKISLVTPDELSKRFDFDFNQRFLLVTFHPETLGGDLDKDIEALLSALDSVNIPVLFTKANADEGGMFINKKITDFCNDRPSSILVDSLGTINYLSAMKYCLAMVGNSSSGIVEAPSFKVPVVNIGNRQKGRVQGENTINCKPVFEEIKKSISLAISAEFKAKIKEMKSPYYREATSENIAEKIYAFLVSGIEGLSKDFYDWSLPL